MADIVANAALGRAVEKNADDPNRIEVLLLKAAEADDALRDHATIAALLGAAGNTEADFTNYARKSSLTASLDQDDVNNVRDLDIPDQTFTSAGNGTNNTLTDAVVNILEPGGSTDSDRTPLTIHDLSVTTDGSDLTLQWDAEGFYRAA